MPKPRKPAKIVPLKTLRIFCEGEKTEPGYLKGYLATLDNTSRQSVIEIEKTRKNTPVQLVEEAIKAKSSSNALPDDEFWVVYDREAVAKYSDNLHARAFDRAQSCGIRVALTNVCFEYWLLLHFVDTTAPYSSYDDLIQRSQFKAEFKKECQHDYDKALSSTFNLVKHRLLIARNRAIRLNQSGIQNANLNKGKPYHINPYVGIVELLTAIEKFK